MAVRLSSCSASLIRETEVVVARGSVQRWPDGLPAHRRKEPICDVAVVVLGASRPEVIAEEGELLVLVGARACRVPAVDDACFVLGESSVVRGTLLLSKLLSG